MKYYYGDSYKEALSNEPVVIRRGRQLRQYEENYAFVIPAYKVDGKKDKEKTEKY